MNSTNVAKTESFERLWNFLATLCFLIAMTALFSRGVCAMTLQDAYLSAKARDPVFLSGRLRIEAARSRVAQSRSVLFPSVTATYQKEQTKGSVSFASDDWIRRGYGSKTWDLRLTQPLFRALAWLDYSQSERQLLLAEIEYANIEQSLIFRVCQVYIEALIAAQTIKDSERTLENLAQHLSLSQKALVLGTGVKIDVSDAIVAKSRAEAGYSLDKANREQKLEALRRLTGQADLGQLRYASRELIVRPQGAAADWVSRARSGSPAVLSKELALVIAKQDIQRNRAAHLPTVDIVASRGLSREAGNLSLPLTLDIDRIASSVAIKIDIPIFSGGLFAGKTREAVALAQIAEAEVTQARDDAENQTREAYSNLMAATEQLDILLGATALAQASVKSTRNAMQAGLRTSTDFLNAVAREQQINSELLRARYQIILSGAKLKYAVGYLLTSDLEEIDRQLDAAL